MNESELFKRLQQLKIDDRVDFILSAINDIRSELVDLEFNLDELFNLTPEFQHELELKKKAKTKLDQFLNSYIQNISVKDLLSIWNQSELDFNTKLSILLEIMCYLYSDSERNEQYGTDLKNSSINSALPYVQTAKDLFRELQFFDDDDQIKLTYNLLKELLARKIENENAKREHEGWLRSRDEQSERRQFARYGSESTICTLCEQNPCMCSDPDPG